MLYEGRTEDARESFTSFLASILYTANKDERAINFEPHFQCTFYLISDTIILVLPPYLSGECQKMR